MIQILQNILTKIIANIENAKMLIKVNERENFQ